MLDNRVLLLSYGRTGSTYYCNSFNNYQKNIDNNYFPVMPEPYVYIKKDWSGYHQFVSKYNLNIDKMVNLDTNEISKSFLVSFKNDKFILKYFTGYIQSVTQNKINNNIVFNRCLKTNTKIHVLYRKNILDVIVSYIIAATTNIWQQNKNNFKNIDYNKLEIKEKIIDEIVNKALSEINSFLDAFKISVDMKLISKVLTYEDNILTNLFDYSSYSPSEHIKQTSNNNKNLIIKRYPVILDKLSSKLKLLNINVTNNFEMVL